MTLHAKIVTSLFCLALCGTLCAVQELIISGSDNSNQGGLNNDGVRGYAVNVPSGNDEFTKLLLHFEGTNGATDFIDSSPSSNQNLTVGGGAQLNTTSPKFGTASGYFGGVGYLEYPETNDFDFSTTNFTVDCWFKLNDLESAQQGIIGTVGQSWSIMYNYQAGCIDLHASADGSSWFTAGDSSPGLKTNYNSNQWYHLAFTWDQQFYRVFVDGILDTVVTNSSGLYPSNFEVGRFLDSTSWIINGYVDEVRVVNGISCWTNDFTPPTGPFEQ